MQIDDHLVGKKCIFKPNPPLWTRFWLGSKGVAEKRDLQHSEHIFLLIGCN